MSPIYEMDTQMKMTPTNKRKHVRILSVINIFYSVHANKETLPALPFPNMCK